MAGNDAVDCLSSYSAVAGLLTKKVVGLELGFRICVKLIQAHSIGFRVQGLWFACYTAVVYVQVVVHPIVLLSVVDHYNRVAKGTSSP